MTSEQKPIGRPRSCFCGECKKCKRADYMRDYWRKAPIEKRRAWMSGRDPEAVRRSDTRRYHEGRKYDPEFQRRERARAAARRAVAKGLIKRGPCERCGEEKVQAHHEDYSEPLAVNWLCPLHHSERHRERVLEQAA